LSTLAIILVAVGGALALLFLGGVVYTMRRQRRNRSVYARHIAEADRALERARAADRGWDRELLESAARDALASERPEWLYDELQLVLVDDRPGVSEDRAHLVATSDEGDLRLVLRRRDDAWELERLD
jgi:cbb3-type cytochrome oxidase subunit 3